MLRICGSAKSPAWYTLRMEDALRQAHDHKDGLPRAPGALTLKAYAKLVVPVRDGGVLALMVSKWTSPDAFDRMIRSEIETRLKVFKAAGSKVE